MSHFHLQPLIRSKLRQSKWTQNNSRFITQTYYDSRVYTRGMKGEDISMQCKAAAMLGSLKHTFCLFLIDGSYILITVWHGWLLLCELKPIHKSIKPQCATGIYYFSSLHSICFTQKEDRKKRAPSSCCVRYSHPTDLPRIYGVCGHYVYHKKQWCPQHHGSNCLH